MLLTDNSTQNRVASFPKIRLGQNRLFEVIMGWIQEQFEKRSERATNASPTPENTAIESHEHDLWNHLAAGFRHDVDEFQRTAMSDLEFDR
jgi:hypothetical protein